MSGLTDEQAERLLASAIRVWNKYGAESDRSDWKAWVELGDVLYHVTDGREGRCGRYDGPPCGEGGDARG